MQALARFIMEGKIPAELWVFLASSFLAFNGQIYIYLFGEDFSLVAPLLLNFVVFLLAGAPLAIGILRFSYARSLFFVLALALPILLSGNFLLLKFFAGVIIFAYLLRIVRNLGLSLMLAAVALIPLSTSIEWMSDAQKEEVARSVLSFKVEAQMDTQTKAKMTNEQLKEKFKQEQIEAFGQLLETMFAASLVVLNLLLVLFGRWLQSLLYYPGGFRQEFLNLKIDFWFAIGTLIVGALLLYFVDFGVKYLIVLLIPYFFVGVALIHSTVEVKELGGGILVAFYIALFLFSQVMLIFLIMTGFLDSLVDFRKRMQA